MRHRHQDDLLVAKLHGTALRYATSDGSDQEAITELRTVTNRTDLLGEAAGLFAASTYPWPERNQRAVHLLIAAGADPGVIATHQAVVRQRLSRWPPSY